MNITELTQVVAQARGRILKAEQKVEAKIAALRKELSDATAADMLLVQKNLEAIEKQLPKELSGDVKSIETPYGVVGFRLTPPALVLPDDDKTLLKKLHAMGREDCIVVKESPSKSAIKKDESLVAALGGSIQQEDRFYEDIEPVGVANVSVKVS